MADCFSTMVADEWVQCSYEDYEVLDDALQAERKRMDEEELVFLVQVEYREGDGVFVYEKDYFGDETLTEGFCLAIGRLLSSVGKEFLEFGFSQTSSGLMESSHEGGRFRIYSDGRLVWPKTAWPRG